MQRRSFLRTAATAAASLPISAFATRVEGNPRPHGTGYGPLVAAFDDTTGLPLLMLPEGFRYLSFGWTGDPMIDGTPTPGRARRHGRPALARRSRAPGAQPRTGRGNAVRQRRVRRASAGGTTTVEFDQQAGNTSARRRA